MTSLERALAALRELNRAQHQRLVFGGAAALGLGALLGVAAFHRGAGWTWWVVPGACLGALLGAPLLALQANRVRARLPAQLRGVVHAFAGGVEEDTLRRAIMQDPGQVALGPGEPGLLRELLTALAVTDERAARVELGWLHGHAPEADLADVSTSDDRWWATAALAPGVGLAEAPAAPEPPVRPPPPATESPADLSPEMEALLTLVREPLPRLEELLSIRTLGLPIEVEGVGLVSIDTIDTALRARRLSDSGDRRAREKDVRGAIARYEAALALVPDPVTTMSLGICHGWLGDRGRALELLETAHRLDPDDGRIRSNLEAMRRTFRG